MIIGQKQFNPITTTTFTFYCLSISFELPKTTQRSQSIAIIIIILSLKCSIFVNSTDPFIKIVNGISASISVCADVTQYESGHVTVSRAFRKSLINLEQVSFGVHCHVTRCCRMCPLGALIDQLRWTDEECCNESLASRLSFLNV